MASSLVAETDWLGSRPVFFDPNSKTHSLSMRDLVRPPEFLESLDPVGLGLYLDFGYSAFGRTPLQRVKFLEANSRLWLNASGDFETELKADPFFEAVDRLPESEIFELLRQEVQDWEQSLPSGQEVILPLSGGFDSRLLLWAIRDKERVRAFTYGLSPNQSKSFEVLTAAELAGKFGVRWEHINIGDFNPLIRDWFEVFGPSVHAHGMYQLEFYRQVRDKVNGTPALLSGIVGDVWAGSIKRIEISSPSDLRKLSYSHGLHADSRFLLFESDATQAQLHFWDSHRAELHDHRFQNLTTVRWKMMLLNYLFKVPESLGFVPWSPYLEKELALQMLNLPHVRRRRRIWQREFLEANDMMPRVKKTWQSGVNNLNHQAMQKRPLNPLPEVLKAIFDSGYIDWINRNVVDSHWKGRAQDYVASVPKGKDVLKRLKLDSRRRAHGAYLCLEPLVATVGESR